jgi:hypothetical protein
MLTHEPRHYGLPVKQMLGLLSLIGQEKHNAAALCIIPANL